MSTLNSFLALLLTCAPALAQDAPPAVFQDLGYEEGLAAAKAKGGVLILDAMTSWCGPCKRMDRTTWIDPRLVSWIEANGVAVQLDMDEHVELKNQLSINAFPTIVLFKGGVEFDRVVGLRSAEEMLAWLGAAGEGKRAKDVVLEELAELRTSEDANATWGLRAKLVEDLMHFGEDAEALTEYMWLWRQLPASSEDVNSRRLAFRHGQQRYSMRDLAARHAAATTAFRGVRDELTASVLAGEANKDALNDWLSLNFITDDEAATVRWAVETAKDGAGARSLPEFEHRLFDLLVTHGEWRTAGLVLGDPVAHVTYLRDTLGAYDEDELPKGKSIPMIPMGGMKPAAKPADAGAKKAKPQDGRPMPAIPMTAGGASRKAVPAIPMTGGSASPEGEDTATKVRRLLTDQFREQAAERYGALLAGERNEEARKVADVLLGELDDSRAHAGLLAVALRAGVIDRSERHQQWLDLLAR